MAAPPRKTTGPLNVGDVVSGGISLLRANFKTYLGLSVKGVLWSLIPVYGWAKASLMYATIGRHGFREVIHQPETVNLVHQKLSPRMWVFLGVGLLVGLIQFAVNYGISTVGSIVTIPLIALGGAGATAVALSGLLMVLAQLVIFTAQMWFQARFWLYDMILAMELEIDATSSISRSWELTKGSATRVLMVLLITYLVLSPLFALAFVPFLFTIPYFVNTSWETPDPTLVGAIFLAVFAFILLLLLALMLSMPLWQSIKSVLYYDLRSRREGMDIQFRDHGGDRSGT
jgi:hypothetical protein